MNSIDEEWSQFIISQYNPTYEREDVVVKKTVINEEPLLDEIEAPQCNDLIISTATKKLFLNMPIDIHTIFWKIPIIEYGIPGNGVIKKQMKIVSRTEEEYQEYKKKIEGIPYLIEDIIKKNQATATTNQEEEEPKFRSSRRIRFKDERKITVGISKKDITVSRGKTKGAFYNCFALIIRFLHKEIYREIHVKIFNTGKLEIPGVLNQELLDIIKILIIDILKPHINEPLYFIENMDNNGVIINSNFNCGFFINREKLYSILRSDKYCIDTSLDSCNYPGVKCKFYFNTELGFDPVLQTGNIMPEDRSMKMKELKKSVKYKIINYMIFRTGSGLIVGNCSEEILNFVFEFVKKILKEEYKHIHISGNGVPGIKIKRTKKIKRIISMNVV
jgi:hypothetical protein